MTRSDVLSKAGMFFAVLLLGLLVLPVAILMVSSTPADLLAGAKHPMFGAAFALSIRTTIVSLLLTVLLGTPLAWWLAKSTSRFAPWVEVLVELPVVLPPAVIGVALLRTFGRTGVFGPTLTRVGISIPFTESAVVLAQLVVAAPFFVQASANAFRKVDLDLLIVARSLGASKASAFFRVALGVCWPGLLAGASLSWARALGEFGATLLFAGNMAAATQTLPLAIFTALESDVRLAVVFSTFLAAAGALLLLLVRVLPAGVHRSDVS